MQSGKSNCDRDSLIGWLDESLTQEERVGVRAHLDGCDACRMRLKSLESTLELARSACQTSRMGPFESRAFVHKVRSRIAVGEQGLLKRLLSPSPGGGFVSGAVVGALVLSIVAGPVSEPGFGSRAPAVVMELESSAGDVGGGEKAEEVTDEELAGAIDDYLLDTASEQELLSEMETLIDQEDLLALLEEYY